MVMSRMPEASAIEKVTGAVAFDFRGVSCPPWRAVWDTSTIRIDNTVSANDFR